VYSKVYSGVCQGCDCKTATVALEYCDGHCQLKMVEHGTES